MGRVVVEFRWVGRELGKCRIECGFVGSFVRSLSGWKCFSSKAIFTCIQSLGVDWYAGFVVRGQ